MFSQLDDYGLCNPHVTVGKRDQSAFSSACFCSDVFTMHMSGISVVQFGVIPSHPWFMAFIPSGFGGVYMWGVGYEG